MRRDAFNFHTVFQDLNNVLFICELIKFIHRDCIKEDEVFAFSNNEMKNVEKNQT